LPCHTSFHTTSRRLAAGRAKKPLTAVRVLQVSAFELPAEQLQRDFGVETAEVVRVLKFELALDPAAESPRTTTDE
jgi:hypothetical protein